MQGQIGWGIMDVVLVVFGIVTGVEGESPLAGAAVNVLDVVGTILLAEEDHRILDQRFAKGRGLPEEAIDDIGMALGEHRRDRIVFGRKLKEGEIFRFRRADLAYIGGGRVDIGKFVNQGI